MKLTLKLHESLPRMAEIIMRFGPARLIRTETGQYRLMGGDAAHRTAAKEWVSLFEHEILLIDPEPCLISGKLRIQTRRP